MTGMVRNPNTNQNPNQDAEKCGTHLIEGRQSQTARPSFYAVVLHSDDVTPRRFIVHILVKLFCKTTVEATRIMLLVHNFGTGVIASYPFEIAESKALQGVRYARMKGYPLQFTVQREE